MSDLDSVLSVDQAAAMTGRTHHGIWAAIRRGRLPARKVGRVWIIDRDELAGYIADADRALGIRKR